MGERGDGEGRETEPRSRKTQRWGEKETRRDTEIGRDKRVRGGERVLASGRDGEAEAERQR